MNILFAFKPSRRLELTFSGSHSPRRKVLPDQYGRPLLCMHQSYFPFVRYLAFINADFQIIHSTVQLLTTIIFFFFFGNFRADNLILTSVSYLLITCYQWGSIFYAYALRLFFRTSTKGSWHIFWEFKCPVVIRSLIFLYCWLVWFVRRSFLLWKPSSFSLPCKQKILSHLMSLFSIFFLPDWHIVMCL